MVAAVAAAGLAPRAAIADRPTDAAGAATAGFARASAVDDILPGNPGVHLVSQTLAPVVDGATAEADAFSELVRRSRQPTQPSGERLGRR